MDDFIYKKEKCEPESASDYAIRYTPDGKSVYAKQKGAEEFRTDFKKNNTAFEVCLGGTDISKDEYDNF